MVQTATWVPRSNVSMSVVALLSDEHPLALELASLREAVSHHQAEAHRANVQLQHHSLEHATILQHLHTLENENVHLHAELQVHRTAGPSGGSHRDALQIQELTLALRRLSDKLDMTDKTLLERLEELAFTQSVRDAAIKARESAVEAAVRLRVELEASHGKERELMNRVKVSEEQRKMSDLVLEEYASLVRSLEGRPSLGSRTSVKDTGAPPRSSLDGLMHARQGLHKLLQDSNSDSEKLHVEIGRLHDALDLARRDLELERAVALEDRRRLAHAQLELHQLKCDDNASAKMVSRYMKFSQSSTDVLHGAIENLKARQESIIASYEARLQHSEDRMASEMRQSEILRRALDELTENISRESYGRRREVVLRLALLGREENLSERLRRWLLRSHEALRKVCSAEEKEDLKEAFKRILGDAEDILSTVDSSSTFEDGPSSSAARVYAAEAAVKGLQAELQRETDRRLYFEYQLATSQPHRSQPLVLTPKSLGASLSHPPAPAAPTSLAASRGPLAPVPPATASRDEHSRDDSTASQPYLNSSAEPAQVNSSSDPVIDSSSPSGAEPILKTSSPTPSRIVRAMDGNLTPAEGEDRDDPHPTTALFENVGEASYASSPLDLLGLSASQDAEKYDARSPTNSVELKHVSTSDRAAESLSSTKQTEADAQVSPVDPTEHPVEVVLSESSESSLDVEDDTTRGDLQPSFSEKPTQIQESVPIIPEPNSGSSPLPMPQDERHKDMSDASLHLDQKMEISGLVFTGEPSEGQNIKVALLLSKLADVHERYVDFQRSYRDCHLSLQELSQTSSDVPGSPKILLVAVARLSDYCEDARVELEIRVADEERIAKGFQTLLSVPGALSDEVNEQEIMRQIEAFLDGSDPAVRRAQDMLKHKLDDLQHDIASVKCAMHSSSSPMLSPQDLHQGHEERPKVSSTSGWASWTGSILTPSRAPSPAPSFGTVMTSPRLRHSSSSQRIRADPNNAQNPFATLGLRIPMPSFIQSPSDTATLPSAMMQRGAPRPRVTSNVFGLGLQGGLMQGMRKSSLALNLNNAVSTSGPTKDIGELDSDVE